MLEKRGEQMPHFRQQDRLRAWRNYLEHWDNLARRVEDQAGKAWRKVSDEEEPGLSDSGTTNEVTLISGVNIKHLRKDLKEARKAAGLISEREFDHVYITAAEAAEILGISLEEFENLDRSPPIWTSARTSVCATGGTGPRPGGTDDSFRPAGRTTSARTVERAPGRCPNSRTDRPGCSRVRRFWLARCWLAGWVDFPLQSLYSLVE